MKKRRSTINMSVSRERLVTSTKERNVHPKRYLNLFKNKTSKMYDMYIDYTEYLNHKI